MSNLSWFIEANSLLTSCQTLSPQNAQHIFIPLSGRTCDTRRMGRRSKQAERCPRCHLHTQHCVCNIIPNIDVPSRLVLIMHRREVGKTTASGPLALAALTNSMRFVHGEQNAPLDLTELQDPKRRLLLLFPAENARILSKDLLSEDPRPVTLVVPDGTWGQATRIAKRVPGLQTAERVVLPEGDPSRWGLRHETRALGLSTFEAITRALGILETQEVQTQLEALFDVVVQRSLAASGRQLTQSGRRVSFGQSPIPEHNPQLEQKEIKTLPIVYQDEHLVAINKPSGLVVHRGWAKDAMPAMQMLRDQLGRFVYPIHRLDRGSSGLLLFSFSGEVARDTQKQFADNSIHKKYLALCRGHKLEKLTIDYPLAKNADSPKRKAQTDIELLGQFERYGLYLASPHQGRLHQIRRHLKHLSHPLIGDTRYGHGEHDRIFRQRFDFNRLALHCAQMSLLHPRSGEPLVLAAPLGEDLRNLLAKLKLLEQAEAAMGKGSFEEIRRDPGEASYEHLKHK